MYKKDLKKLTPKALKALASALKRSRDASQNIYDRTQGVITHAGGRKELKQHRGWYERQLDKVYAVMADKEDREYQKWLKDPRSGSHPPGLGKTRIIRRKR